MKAKIFLTAALVALGAARAAAAVVTLRDGSVLRGEVTGQTVDGLELATPEGTIHVGRARIARIDFAEAAPEREPAPEPARQRLSLGAGFAVPVGHVDFRSIGGGSADNGDLGVQFNAEYLYFPTPRLGAGFDVDYFDRSGTDSPRLLPGANSSVSGDTWLALGVLRYSLTDRGTTRPYVLVGAGGAWNTVTVDAHEGSWPDNGAAETRRLIDDGAFVPAGSLRVGVDLNGAPFRPGALTLEAGWTWLDSARYAATPAGEKLGLSNVSGPLNILALTARYGWSL